MITIPVYNIKGDELEKINLDEKFFDGKVNKALLHQVVLMYQANKRQGTASTKTRKEVSGGGKKPWKQKGTGRARAGSIRSPLWRHGGVVFGPHPHDFGYDLPQKMKKLAVQSSFNAKFNDNELFVLDSIKLISAKTKEFNNIVKNLCPRFADGKNTNLFVLSNIDKNTLLASRNIRGVSVKSDRNFSAYDVLKHKNLIVTKDALNNIVHNLKEAH